MTGIYFHSDVTTDPEMVQEKHLSSIDAVITILMYGILARQGRETKHGLHLQFDEPIPATVFSYTNHTQIGAIKRDLGVHLVEELVGKRVTVYHHNEAPHPVLGFSKRV